jgi:predicted nucleic acid-binding Zn ribbon protein
MEDNEQQTIELYENRCCVCHVAFWQKPRGRLRRTCSAACRQKLYRMRHQKPKVERQQKEIKPIGVVMEAGTHCPVCGEPMEQPERGRKRKTCSEKCRKRLWRQQNPRCLVCGKHFKMAKYQKEQKYCSEQCRWQAAKLQQRQRQREQDFAELAGYRPEWLPRPGSGYREEMVPWEGDEQEAVVREREPEPNYERAMMTEAEKLAEQAAIAAEEQARALEQAEQARKARRLAWELLEDESKWW